ncbi:helix-turn-helix domain-containing protein [Hydrogenovibrio marinus]|uniref:HTH araC/xylS-type domain-containing protein n=1 Tax=Hydrogenovibrio marinus TaxID=28885 RepID=A0A066ZX95_HYDMR|nr:helix-turn-helix transcriptional regulator [Hydrogenovibrio marinus]KDN94685.1 hypothetical protein EI16_12360 [Hydrogenovibrio marinus]
MEIIDQVKDEIKKQLLNQKVTDESVAKSMGVSSRTLQRKLKAQKTTFKSLFNEIWLDMANKHIQTKELPLKDVAKLIGFSNLSAFSRAYKRLTGVSPSYAQVEE